jgi:hypothetical protein
MTLRRSPVVPGTSHRPARLFGALVVALALSAGVVGALALGSAGAAPTTHTTTTTIPPFPGADTTLPQNQWPNDPGFAGCENRDPNDNCAGSDDWFLYGPLTGDTCRAPGSNVADQPHPDGGLPCWARGATDPQHSAGINAMGAWAQGNTGRNDVLIAYIEGGVNYHSDGIKDALDNVYINPGELPYPEDTAGHDKGKYDYDGNGRFDIRDYVDDPRVNPDCPNGTQPFTAFDEGTTRSCIAGGQHTYLNSVNIGNLGQTKYLSPEDLIAVFGHCLITDHHLGACPAGGKFDNDGNGYPNDVSGWNTYRNNNDPQTEDPGYGHPSGGFRNTVSEANNHYGSVGNCRDCRIVPVKQGAECLGLSNKWAQAILYATNLGAKVISSVVVSYQYSSYGREAVEYANKHGVLLSFDSNDFDSTDHTDGMMYPHAIPGNAVVTNLGEDQDTQWFRARSNITSYGPHNIFSGEEQTTSGATPFMAGLLGMTLSASENERDAGHIPRAYTPNEVKQALMDTASPITPQTQAPNVAKQWPGNPNSATDATHTNWSTQYGYGRIDLGAATALIKTDHVPPTTEITSPTWYQYVDPAKHPKLDVTGYIHPSAWLSEGVNWVAEWAAKGGDPADSDFHTFASGHGGRDGKIGTIDLSQLPKGYASKPGANTNTPTGGENYSVTVRIRAVDGGLKGEDRRTFTARTDPQLVGDPLNVGGEPAAGSSYADLQGRHEQDFIVGTADGDVRVLRPSGNTVPGFPVHTNLLRATDPNNPENGRGYSYRSTLALRDARDPISGTAVGDIDDDGSLDVVATTNSGSVYAWSSTGKLLPGFPTSQNRYYAMNQVPTPRSTVDGSRNPATGNWSPPVLADLNGDGKLEILESAFDGHVYAWKANGQTVPGWPVKIAPTAGALAKAGADPDKLIRDPKLMFAPAVGDVLGTGHPQVYVSGFDCSSDKSTVYIYGIQPDGNNHAGGAYLPGWPAGVASLASCYDQSIDFVEEGAGPPVIMPVNGKPRVVVTPTGATPEVLTGTGTIERRMALTCSNAKLCGGTPPYMGPDSVLVGITGQGGAGDLTGSGTPNYVQSMAGAPSTLNAVGSAPAGQATLGQSYEQAWDPATGKPVPGLLGRQDGFSFFTAPLVVGLGTGKQRAAVESNDSNWIHAYQPDGKEAPGFPKNVGQWPSFSGVVGDAKDNGKLRLAYGTREGLVFQWDVGGTAAANDQWWHYRHDEHNTGAWGTDTRRPAIVDGAKSKRGKGTKVTLTWTAPGDDGVVGTVKGYTIKASTKKQTPGKFPRGKVVKPPVPTAAGTTQSLTFHITKNTYVAIRSYDEAGNVSATKYLKLTARKKPKHKKS